ncbi:TetR/AcrR family transcriptional regulator [Streptacidiphilus jiangxiensis]|uniref:DNA-binding transcriptional regulator, AcrR family n=1 Tax=Streptacidiphilus jiangxiensis TaxID=235985 RepID=A0A1H7P925_STRJI|nr:TetR/AcrR family transcriptional regulator [Streptacidiphilus jiangxiensis]SEL32272.1 DNA-binding transcriptional regulator, AcrR family [Streptacidiphilus jiangxiensis]
MTVKESYHHGNLRQALIDAGVALARAGGPEAIGLREASRRAGVSHNAAYGHFADRSSLVAAVADRCMQELGLLMRRRTQGIAESDPAAGAGARLNALGRAYVDFARDEPGWFRTAFGAPPAHTAHDRLEAAALPEGHPFRQLNDALDDLVTSGVLPSSRRPGAEYAAWSAVHGFAGLLLDGPLHDMPPSQADQALTVVLDVVSRGL